MLLYHAYERLKEVGDGLGKYAQHILDLFPQFVRLELVPVALEYGVGRAQYAIDDVKVTCGLELFDHGGQQVGPLVRKVLATYDAYGVGQLTLYLLGTGDHKLGNACLNRVAVLAEDAIDFLRVLRVVAAFPVLFYVVLEGDRGGHTQMHGQVGLVA